MSKSISVQDRPKNLPRLGTPAAEDYFRAYVSLNRFFNWVLYMAQSIDTMKETAHQALIEVEDDSAKRAEMEQKWSEKKGMIDELKRNRQVLLEIVLVRQVENYLAYLSGLLFEIFRQRPETLRTSERVELAEVLRHDTLDDFVKAEAERRVEQLSYKSLDTLAEFFKDRFGLELFPENERDKVLEAIEVRNISVHNRCIINQRFCNRTGEDESKIGKRKELFVDVLERLEPILCGGVSRLDKAAKAALRLKRIRFGDLND